MGDFLVGFRSTFATRDWAKSWFVFTAMFLVPLVGPFIAAGWAIERTRSVAAGDAEIPPLAFGRYLAQGVAGTAGTMLWQLIPLVGSLLSQAALGHFAARGAFGGFFDFKGILARVKGDLAGYVMVIVKVSLVAFPVSLLGSLSFIPLAMSGGGELSVGSLVFAGVAVTLMFLATFFVAMASSYYLGAWVGGVEAAAPAAAPATPIPTPDTFGDARTPLPIPADAPMAALFPQEPPAVPALPPNAVAVFTAEAAALNPALPGQPVLFAGTEFPIPSLGKAVPAAAVMQMDARGLLQWVKPELKDAVARMAG